MTLAKQIIDSGKLGRIFYFRGQFLQDWTISEDLPQGGAALWRLDVAAAGSGVTGDLLAHNIDTAMWLNGADSVGNRATQTDKNNVVTTWTYDPTSQLTSEQRSGTTGGSGDFDFDYTYDPVGNKELEVNNLAGTRTTYTYDAANQLATSVDSTADDHVCAVCPRPCRGDSHDHAHPQRRQATEAESLFARRKATREP